MKPYGVISDTHHHAWSSFSTTLPSGINSRLSTILSETERAADAVFKAGGDTLVHAGDLFHVRGSVAPSVLNPTLWVYRRLVDSGLRIVINAGNHDLEGRDATEIGSAITALREAVCTIVNEPKFLPQINLALVPYISSVAQLKTVLEDLQGNAVAADCDLIIHAGIDGVIKGLPNHGLDADYLSKLKFKRTLAGHYHHHKKLADNVWSIGALTHQTWGDIGTKAGFLTVHDGEVKWHASHAPSFVELDATTAPEEIPLLVDGNYVRARIVSSKPSEVEELRQYLIDAGALGVSIVSQPATGVTRKGSSVKAGASLEVSVEEFIKLGTFADKARLSSVCADVLSEARLASV